MNLLVVFQLRLPELEILKMSNLPWLILQRWSIGMQDSVSCKYKYLQQCDTANQEVYLQKLRSFYPDECSRQAVVLERRAIQLMVDEGFGNKDVMGLMDLGLGFVLGIK